MTDTSFYERVLEALHLDLLGAGFTDQGLITSDQTAKSAACQSLLSSFYKKLSPNSVNKTADQRALEKFKSLNSSIKDEFQPEIRSEFDRLLIDQFRLVFAKSIEDEWDQIGSFTEFLGETIKTGPGASLGVRSDSIYTKLFDGDLTATHPYLVTLYRAAISQSGLWASAELRRSKKFGIKIVDGNRLFFVPKTTEISRTCCTEPLVNMVLQQGIGAFLERVLQKHFGINLSTQPDINQRMARVGSIDGSYATIDLSSASDSISWAMMRWACPNGLLGALQITRCERTVLPDGTVMPLNMISTMGNGFTFPLETLIFASAVKAVYSFCADSSALKTDRGWQASVFGDDIIVRKNCYEPLLRLLALLGFDVNEGKSFNSGPFRESCGADYFYGSQIRGVYIRTLKTPPDRYSAFNRLARWSVRHRVTLYRTLHLLKESVKFLPVPFFEDDSCGLKVPYASTKSLAKRDGLYRQTSYRKLAHTPKRVSVPTNLEESRRLGFRDFNRFGWAAVALAGFVGKPPSSVTKDGGDSRPFPRYLQLREKGAVKRRRMVKAFSPYWDYRPSDSDLDDRQFQDWKILVDLVVSDD